MINANYENNQRISVFCNTISENNWMPFDQKFILNQNEIRLFGFHIDEFMDKIAPFTDLLDETELSQSLKYFKLEDRQQYVITRGVLKTLIGKYLKQQPEEIKIKEGKNKKPTIGNGLDLHFNVSHSNGLVVIAIHELPIGVDIEKINMQFAYKDIMTISFNNDEIVRIETDNNPCSQFYKLWTRKEAFAKALGKGIDEDFHLLPSIEGKHELDCQIVQSLENWTISTFNLNSESIGAIAFQNNNLIKVNFYRIKMNDI